MATYVNVFSICDVNSFANTSSRCAKSRMSCRNHSVGMTRPFFCFTACWTEFLMALTFNISNSYRTIPVGIAEFGTVFTVPYGTIFAASVVAVVPIGILVFIFRKFVISGLTSGAVKG